MEKHIFIIKLMNRPISTDGQRKNGVDDYKLDNRTKYLVIVNTHLLIKAFSNEACYMLINYAIGFFFFILKIHL